MRKLKMQLDTLKVDSFTTVGETRGLTGSVRAHEATRLDDSCGCAPPSDGCSIGCPMTVGCGPVSNNCWTVIEN